MTKTATPPGPVAWFGDCGRNHRQRLQGESGQTTIALAGVMVIALVLAMGLAIVGDAMIHRARARNGADAVALAAAVSNERAVDLRSWYESQGVQVSVEQIGDRSVAYATSGPSQAKAWAGLIDDDVDVSPALRAIVARVEQLRGLTMTTVSWQRSAFSLSGSEAAVMTSMQSEFDLCSTVETATQWRFESC